MPLGMAEAGPRIEKASVGVAPGGGGCLAMYAGTMMKKRHTASGNTASRLGSRQQKLYAARNDNVWLGLRQENSLISRF